MEEIVIEDIIIEDIIIEDIINRRYYYTRRYIEDIRHKECIIKKVCRGR